MSFESRRTVDSIVTGCHRRTLFNTDAERNCSRKSPSDETVLDVEQFRSAHCTSNGDRVRISRRTASASASPARRDGWVTNRRRRSKPFVQIIRDVIIYGGRLAGVARRNVLSFIGRACSVLSTTFLIYARRRRRRYESGARRRVSVAPTVEPCTGTDDDDDRRYPRGIAGPPSTLLPSKR